MIGLIIATHAGLAKPLLSAAESIVGAIPYATCHNLDRNVDLEASYQELALAVEKVGVCGEGVLIMTDMFGGTPANVSARLLEMGRVEVLNAVNLPIVLKFASSRQSMDLSTLAVFLKKYGQKSIILTSEILFGMDD